MSKVVTSDEFCTEKGIKSTKAKLQVDINIFNIYKYSMQEFIYPSISIYIFFKLFLIFFSFLFLFSFFFFSLFLNFFLYFLLIRAN